MKTPDKIYISIERTYGATDGQVIAMVTQHSERQSVNDVEYIRKDALMEWAEEQQRKWEECINTSKKFPELEKSWINYSGAKIQTEALIEKLNSM